MFYQMVHTSTTMAIDIGIGKRQSEWRKHFTKDHKLDVPKRAGLPNLEGAEARRGWYFSFELLICI
jgi:hypothetical protein